MSAAGVSSWSGDRSEDGLYWAALLLLRSTPPTSDVFIRPSTHAGWAHQQMRAQLTAVAEDRHTWSRLVDQDDLQERVANLDAAWEAAELAQEEIERDRIAEAELSSERVQLFRDGVQSEFAGRRVLAGALAIPGRLIQVERPQAFEEDGARVVREVPPKGWLVDESVYRLEERVGGGLADDQDEIILRQLHEAAEHEEVEAGQGEVEGLVEVVNTWIETRGQPPLILAPNHYRLRESLFALGFADDGGSGNGPFGRISGAEVFLVGRNEGQPVLLVDAQGARLTEYVVNGFPSGSRLSCSPRTRRRKSSTAD